MRISRFVGDTDSVFLRLQNPFLRGSAVRRFQELTDSLGIDFGPNDSVYGPNTERRRNGCTLAVEYLPLRLL